MTLASGHAVLPWGYRNSAPSGHYHLHFSPNAHKPAGKSQGQRVSEAAVQSLENFTPADEQGKRKHLFHKISDGRITFDPETGR